MHDRSEEAGSSDQSSVCDLLEDLGQTAGQMMGQLPADSVKPTLKLSHLMFS